MSTKAASTKRNSTKATEAKIDSTAVEPIIVDEAALAEHIEKLGQQGIEAAEAAEAEANEPKVVPFYELDTALILAAYASADTKGKAKIRVDLKAAIDRDSRAAIEAMNDQPLMIELMNRVKIMNAHADAIKAAGSVSRRAEVQVDYVDLLARRVATWRDAAEIVLANVAAFLPEGTEVPEDFEQYVNELAVDTENRVEINHAEQVAFLVNAPLHVASGPRRSVADHLAAWRASVEPGTFATIAQLASFKSGVYGANEKLDGRIAARLFPKDGDSTVPGMRPVAASGGTARGVIAE